jgi:DNA-binding transcriptional LysR family regulator
VSRRLAAAEEALGAVLVIRGGRDFIFTAEGKAALEAAKGMQTLAASATAAIRAAKAGVEGLVRISAVPGAAPLMLELPERVAARHPNLRVEISADFHRSDLARGEADIAMRMVEPREPDLVARQCFEVGISAFASKAYVERHGTPETFEDLRRHRLILYNSQFADRPHFRLFEPYAGANALTMRADGPDMALSLIAAGNGIGLVNDYYGARAPDLVRLFDGPLAFVPGYVVTHESARATARVKVVVDMLSAFLKERGSLLSGRRDKAHREPGASRT